MKIFLFIIWCFISFALAILKGLSWDFKGKSKELYVGDIIFMALTLPVWIAVGIYILLERLFKNKRK